MQKFVIMQKVGVLTNAEEIYMKINIGIKFFETK